MIILPAIDIKDNKCVRLSQGNFNKVTVYSSDPLEMALKWEEKGAEYLHLVDLDGARSQALINRESIEKIVKNINIPVQIGGGIRDEEKVKNLLDLGVTRVILGTAAVENIKLVEDLIAEYGSEKIVVGIDAKDGKVATRGWEVISQIDSLSLCKELEKIGVETIVYTDIAKDGMLQGPNFSIYEELMDKTNLDIVASGGISFIEDIKRLKKMDIYGAIIGKAFYDSLLKFEEVMECLV
ncbi:MAG: 1-(5-phosphoribosyl)-5-[(5-phosphoribosylamino)methylideneamino]imidazole-4-carboxamide isomerase [Tissierellia bacterium]|nr:1-(5-phosphoribosyl)-5-[(5-phosphoribosylamino)methylideneamino]imidazole-4-carboxamide isomerase [Tissierellia bacterium]